MSYGVIYADLLQYCRPAKVPARWRRFAESGSDVYLLPNNLDRVLKTLKRKHRLKDLIASRVVEHCADGSIRISEVLRNVTEPVICLRATPDGTPTDILTNLGPLSGRLSLQACAGDHLVRERVRQLNLLLLTFSFNDWIALREVSLPAAPSFGLSCFTPETLQQFQKQVPLPPHRLIIVGWELSMLKNNRPAGLDPVVHSITSICGSLGLSLDEVLVWRPSLAGIQSLDTCVAVGSATDVAEAVLRSIDEFSESIAPTNQRLQKPVDLLTARRKLHDVLVRSSTPGCRRRQVKELGRAVDQVYVEPLLAQALEQDDLIERTRLAAVAELNGVLHPTLAVCKAKLQREIAENGLRNIERVLDSSGLTKLLDSFGQLIKKEKE